MSSRRRLLAIPLVVALSWPGAAQALTLEAAKAENLVGERPDGYVGIVVADPPSEVRELVAQVNARRRAAYEEIAKKNGVPVEAVAALAGQRLIDRTPVGQYVMDAQGRWVQK